MTINITPKELLDMRKWEAYCNLTGCNPQAINEGGASDKLSLTVMQAKHLALI